MDSAFAAARLCQFLSAMVLGGSPLFFLYGMAPEDAPAWRRGLLLAAAAVGGASTLCWLMLQSASLAESLAAAFDPSALVSLIDTGFGRAAGVRFLLFATALGLVWTRRRPPWALLSVVGLATAASFAWTGHGASGEGAAGTIHALADVAHLVAAAIWIGALVPLAAVLGRTRPSLDPARRAAVSLGLDRFSRIGPAVVGVLVLSGVVNSWLLVGPQHLGELGRTPYGRLLLAKLALFAAMVGLAAVNRFVLAKRLHSAGGPQPDGAAAATRASLLTETGLAIGVLALVSWLGMLNPPAG